MSVTAAAGFVAAGAHCGLKDGGAPDLAIVATGDGRTVPAAAVFTTNRMTAAPVLVSRDHLDATAGSAAAVVLNSGNANAATGRPGRDAAERTCAVAAAELGCDTEEVLVCSTGLIGIPLPIATVTAGLPGLVAARRPDGAGDAAQAILTTDTCRKEAVRRRGEVTVGGMAKGAAMLAPSMATMLAVLTTDADADPHALGRVLLAGTSASFGALSVDGASSTNDTVILLASGRAGPIEEADLGEAVAGVCADLSTQMASDAEGATKLVRVTVTGAASDVDARRGARAVADSQLVKCSWYGGDPYWGRVASELGAAGIGFEQDRISIAYGGIVVAEGGVAAGHDTGAIEKVMAERFIEVSADLGLGVGSASILTNDLTPGYIAENMRTS